MYLHHYGLKDKPFELVHDARYYFAAAHQVPLDVLCYSIEERQGLALLLGGAGTGKTTILKRLLQSFSHGLRGALFSDLSIGGHPLLPQLARALGVKNTDDDRELISALWTLLRRQASESNRVVVMIDEAQELTSEQLHEVRYLTNMERNGERLLEIVLAGQDSLEQKLAATEFAGLSQRAVVRARVEPFDLEHTAAYIKHRLRTAGAPNPSMFEASAIAAIHRWSGGVARLINTVCDRALLVGFIEDLRTIGPSIVETALADLNEPGAEQLTNGEEAFDDPAESPLSSRMDALEEKLDLLIEMMLKWGLGDTDSAGSPGLRRGLDDRERARSLGILRRRFWLGFIPAVILFGSVGTAIMVLPELYLSRATVVIERQQIPSEIVRSTVTSALETRLRVIQQEVLSRERLEDLMARFELYPDLIDRVPMEAIVGRMRRDVDVVFSGTRPGREDATVAFTIKSTTTRKAGGLMKAPRRGLHRAEGG